MSVRDIQRETEAAKSLLANLRDIGADGDEEIVKTAIEGETNLLEVIDAALLQAAQDEAAVKALSQLIVQTEARCSRLSRRVDLTKTALASALQAIGERKMERPLATLTIKPTGPSVVITDEQSVPPHFWKKPEPKIDKAELKKALKEGPVPGAELSNGGETMQWRFT